MASEITDDEVQILSEKKEEKATGSPINVESGDEEVIEVCEVGMANLEEKKDGKDNYSKNHQVQTTTRCDVLKDVTCSICLGEFDNKSFLDQCFHAFCFYCILQWSEIVRTCPLCKASFSQIIHSVRSMMEYELYKLPSEGRLPKQQVSVNARRFGHNISLMDNAYISQQQYASSSNSQERRAQRRERRLSFRKQRLNAAKEKRKSIYANNLWVQTVTQRGRVKFRDTSPQFFRGNPACIHRLVPWLTRELHSLLVDEQSHVDFILQLIMTLVTKVDIGSDQFIEQLQPFLFSKTHQFAHEFLSFARSPYDMTAYDARAQYNWPRSNINQESETPVILNTSTTVDIGSDQFIEQLQPFLFSKTHQFAHEFLSFARSPYDMTAYDARAQYNWPRSNINQESETPVILNTSTTGWDSPDEFGTSGLSVLSISPGPSGLSHSMLSSHWNEEINSQENDEWSPPPVAKERQQQRFSLIDDSSISDGYVYKGPNNAVNEASNVDKFKTSRQHYYKFKNKYSRKNDSRSVLEPLPSHSHPATGYITASSSGSTERGGRSAVVIVSSDESGSPERRKVPGESKTGKSNRNTERFTSSEKRSSRSLSPLQNTQSDSRVNKVRRKSRQDFRQSSSRKHAVKRPLKSRGRRSQSSSRAITRSARSTTSSSRSKSPVASPSRDSKSVDSRSRTPECVLGKTMKVENVRPSSPTEEEMRQEISELEKKIAEDTKRLTQLLIKQEKRKLCSRATNLYSVLNVENSPADELSR